VVLDEVFVDRLGVPSLVRFGADEGAKRLRIAARDRRRPSSFVGQVRQTPESSPHLCRKK
jgi:hypothetical protein